MGASARAVPVIGIVAGEASGDLLGAHLIRSLRAQRPQLDFVGIGGPRMQSAGMHVMFPMEKLAVRGYVEVLRHYFEILSIRRRLAAHFLKHPPDLFIGVDAPDFNLGLERRLKAAGIATAHYVSPSIWAWRGNRIHGIKHAVSKMLTVFPFEARLYEAHGIPVAYVGHPLADMLAGYPGRAAAREQLRLGAGARVITLMPGSRASELEYMADLFVATARRIQEAVPDIVFLAPFVNRTTRDVFEAALYRGGEPLKVTLLFGHAHDAMAAADVVIAASGTATLEAALLRRPMVIAYRMPKLSWWLLKGRNYQPWIGLPNILAQDFVVPEFLQDDATPDNLAQAAVNILFDSTVRDRLEARFGAIVEELRQNTAQKLAGAILPMLGDARP